MKQIILAVSYRAEQMEKELKHVEEQVKEICERRERDTEVDKSIVSESLSVSVF